MDNVNGNEIYVENGEILNYKFVKVKKGIDIFVELLFYNILVCLKYIKSLYIELGKIIDIVNRMVMSYLDIWIVFILDGKIMLSINGLGWINEVMVEIYGMKVVWDLVYIFGDISDYYIEGFVVKFEYFRSNKYYIFIFINGWYIKNFMLNKVILEGYYIFLIIGRFLICYINIEMDLILVDVNVYLIKLEVCLLKEE